MTADAVAEIGQWIAGLQPTARRKIVGITGPPGVGKTTVAEALANSFPRPVPLVPMDGFHLAHAALEATGSAAVKGAPHTFDAWGFVALLQRLRSQHAEEVVYAPRFDRGLGEPVAGAVPVHPEDELVIVEGNYLLLAEPPWDRVAPLLDGCAYLELAPDVRVERLVARHVRFGKAPGDARRFVERSDERNTTVIEATRSRADIVMALDGGEA